MSLHSIGVFKGLSGEAIRQLEQSSILVEPRDGEAIISQGDPSDAVYAITGGDGHVRIGTIDRHSKALMVEVFGAGEIFGEIGVIDGRVRTATATAVGRLRLMKIRQTVFLAALANYPTVGEALCRIVIPRLRRTYNSSRMLRSGPWKPVSRGRSCISRGGRAGRRRRGGYLPTHRLRQADLADLLGATTRSIITILNSWRAAGLVVYDTERAFLTVTDIAAMRAIVETNV